MELLVCLLLLECYSVWIALMNISFILLQEQLQGVLNGNFFFENAGKLRIIILRRKM
jgi:hypothetical protein